MALARAGRMLAVAGLGCHEEAESAIVWMPALMPSLSADLGEAVQNVLNGFDVGRGDHNERAVGFLQRSIDPELSHDALKQGGLSCSRGAVNREHLTCAETSQLHHRLTLRRRQRIFSIDVTHRA